MAKYGYLILAAISGAAMAVQGGFNAALGKVIGIWESTLTVHVIGSVIAFVVLLLTNGFGGFLKYDQAPWYVYLGGVLNVLIIYAVVKTIPQVGVGNATTAIIVAQLLMALFLDTLGIGGEKIPFRYMDLVGIALLAVGAKILLL